MSQYGPASSFLLVGGRNISSDTFTLEETVEGTLEEMHGLGEAWERSLPVGLARVTLDAGGGIYDDRVGGIVEALQAKGDTKQLVAYGFAGQTVGADCVILDGSYAVIWKRISGRDALLHANAQHRITGSYGQARILHGLTAEITDPGAGTVIDSAADLLARRVAITSSSVANPSVITTPLDHGLVNGEIILITGHSGSTPSINAGNGYAVTVTGLKTFTIPVNVTVGGTGGYFQKVSSLGLNADLHLTALTLGGFTNLVVKVQHSIDNSS